MRITVPFLFLLIASTLCAVSGTGNAAVPDASCGGEEDGTALFHNSYTPPTAEDVMSDLVQTGIEAMPYIAAVSICAIPAIIRRRRRR